MGAPQSEFRGTRKAFNILIPQILASEAHFDVSNGTTHWDLGLSQKIPPA